MLFATDHRDPGLICDPFRSIQILNILIVIVSFIILIRRQKWLGEKQYAALTQRINS